MNTRRILDRITTTLAIVACLGFVVGLFDVALTRPVVAPYAPPPPIDATERDAELSVVVVSAGDAPLGCGAEGDSGTAHDCDRADAHVDAPPIAGATVRVFWVQQGRYYLAATARSDDDGHVRLRELPRGVVWVLAEAPGDARGSTQLVLGGEPRRVRLALVDAYLLGVTVLDEATKPIPRATVLVTATDPLPYGALTRSDGVARFTRLPPAPWRLKASASGYESVTRSDVRGNVTITLRNLGSLQVQVEDLDGAPAAGATVTIAGSSLWPARRAETDATGVARIAGLLAGAYDLKAHRGDLVSETLLGLTLERGQRESVTLRLIPGRMVTAVVTDGEEEESSVVAGADVVLVEGGLSSFPLRGRTGADGTVTLGPIAPGAATLAARAPEFVARAAVPVPEVLEGPVRIALLRGATLEGEVVDTRGYPVDGASVEVIGTDRYGLPIAETPLLLSFRRTHFAWALSGPHPLIPVGELGVMPGPVPPIPPPGSPGGGLGPGWPAASPSPDAPDELVEPWVTRADGTFRARPVTPGRVRALVRHPAYVQGVSEAVTLGPGAVAKVKVVLRVGGTLEGRVLDYRGFPVAGARVDVSSVSGTFEYTTLTASDGTFAFAAVPEEIWLSVARPDDLSRVVWRQRAQVKDDERTEVELTLPEKREPVRIVVADEHDQPVDGAQVTVMSLDPGTPLRRTLFSGADGSVTIPDARGLPLRVAVEAPGWARVARSVDRASDTLQIALRHGVIVSGTVTAVRGRRSVSGAQVTIVSGGWRRTAITDEGGAYQIREVLPGPVRLIVSHPEYATREVGAEVQRTERADRPYELPAVDLEEPGSIEGEVVDEDDEPVAGARVAVGVAPAYLPVGVTPPGMAVTDAHGRFKLAGLSPGKLELEAYAPDVGRGSVKDVDVTAGRPTTGVVIRLASEAGEADPAASGSVAITLGERGAEAVEVVVVHVAELSEAERSGLEVGDIILSVDGTVPQSMADARTHLSGRAGSDVVIQVQRGDETLSLRVARERVRR